MYNRTCNIKVTETEYSFEEYIWEIHKLIDESLQWHYTMSVKTNSHMSPGYIPSYAPYIPLSVMPTSSIPTAKKTYTVNVKNISEKKQLKLMKAFIKTIAGKIKL